MPEYEKCREVCAFLVLGGAEPLSTHDEQRPGASQTFCAVKNGGLRLLRHGAGVDEVPSSFLFLAAGSSQPLDCWEGSAHDHPASMLFLTCTPQKYSCIQRRTFVSRAPWISADSTWCGACDPLLYLIIDRCTS